MNSTKCRKCGLANFATDFECRRCGTTLFAASNTNASRPRISIVAILIFAGVAAAAYYIFMGVQDSVGKVNTGEANRIAAQPANQPDAGLSRTEYDRQRSQRVANAVGASSGLAEHNNRTQQTQNTIDQLTNSNASGSPR